MKTKLFAAVVAALTLASIGAASAQDYRRGDGGEWRHRAEITVRNDDGRRFDFGRRDRAFYRFIDHPYNFRPGLTYAYTDRCGRAGCLVYVYRPGQRRPVDYVYAPRLPRWMNGGWRNDRDERWDDRDDHHRDDRWDDRRDDDREWRDDRDLRGGPR